MTPSDQELQQFGRAVDTIPMQLAAQQGDIEVSAGGRDRQHEAVRILEQPRFGAALGRDAGVRRRRSEATAARLVALIDRIGVHAAAGGAGMVSTHDPGVIDRIGARRFARG